MVMVPFPPCGCGCGVLAVSNLGCTASCFAYVLSNKPRLIIPKPNNHALNLDTAQRVRFWECFQELQCLIHGGDELITTLQSDNFQLVLSQNDDNASFCENGTLPLGWEGEETNGAWDIYRVPIYRSLK